MFKIRLTAFFYSRRLAANAFVIPALVAIVVVVIYPLITLFYNSFFLFRGFRKEFVGLQHYSVALSESSFWGDFLRTLIFTGSTVGIGTAIALIAVMALGRIRRGKHVYLVILLIPWLMPMISASLMWRWMLDKTFGAINDLLMRVGFKSLVHSWLSEPSLALPSCIVADMWNQIPFSLLILWAGMQSIPDQLYEAAEIDGAGGWKRFYYITFPLLKPSLLIVLILRTMFSLRAYDIIYGLTRGGPGDSSRVISFHIIESGIKFLQMGYASAVSVILLLFTSTFVVYYMRELTKEKMV